MDAATIMLMTIKTPCLPCRYPPDKRLLSFLCSYLRNFTHSNMPTVEPSFCSITE